MRPTLLPSRRGRLARLAAVILPALILAAATTPGSARTSHRHLARHRPPVAAAEARPVPPDPQSLAAYRSGFAFGLLDLGISGTPDAISPYAPAGYGFRRPGYDGPGYGYPGY